MKTNKNTVKAVATVKAAAVAAKVETASAVESRATYTKNTRAAAEANGCGLNTFGSWVGQHNILDSLVRMVCFSYHIICAAIAEMDGQVVVHVTQGCKGAHIGLCMMFKGVKFTDFAGVERTHDVFVKDNGAMYIDGLCEGFSVMSESELRLQAVKLNDVRKVKLENFVVDVKSKVGTWQGNVVDAALLGTLNGRYQGLMFRDDSGVRVVTRIFGETKDHETQRAVSVVSLAGDAKETAKRWLFDGIAETVAKVKVKAKAATATKAAVKVK